MLEWLDSLNNDQIDLLIVVTFIIVFVTSFKYWTRASANYTADHKAKDNAKWKEWDKQRTVELAEYTKKYKAKLAAQWDIDHKDD